MAPNSGKSSKTSVNVPLEPQSLAASASGSSYAAVANARAFPGAPTPAPASPLLGSINLAPNAHSIFKSFSENRSG